MTTKIINTSGVNGPQTDFSSAYASILVDTSGNYVTLGSTGGVSSVNGITGNVNLVPGTNVSINNFGNNITISAGTGGSSPLFSYNEIPSGTINGINTFYTIQNPPINSSLELYWNGLLMDIPDDFNLSGTNIVFTFAPVTNSKIVCNYEFAGSGATFNNSYNEIPTGLVNGINSTFTFLSIPINNSMQLFENGIYQMDPSDYTTSGNSVSFVSPPVVSSRILGSYQY